MQQGKRDPREYKKEFNRHYSKDAMTYMNSLFKTHKEEVVKKLKEITKDAENGTDKLKKHLEKNRGCTGETIYINLQAVLYNIRNTKDSRTFRELNRGTKKEIYRKI